VTEVFLSANVKWIGIIFSDSCVRVLIVYLVVLCNALHRVALPPFPLPIQWCTFSFCVNRTVLKWGDEVAWFAVQACDTILRWLILHSDYVFGFCCICQRIERIDFLICTWYRIASYDIFI
jgi:hypothetical protein